MEHKNSDSSLLSGNQGILSFRDNFVTIGWYTIRFSEPVYSGVHGGIKRFYKVEPEKDHAATLDHMVAATAA